MPLSFSCYGSRSPVGPRPRGQTSAAVQDESPASRTIHSRVLTPAASCVSRGLSFLLCKMGQYKHLLLGGQGG